MPPFSSSAVTSHAGSHTQRPWEVERSTMPLNSWEEYDSCINIKTTGMGLIPVLSKSTKSELK